MVIRQANWTETSCDTLEGKPIRGSKLAGQARQHCDESAIQILALEYIRGRMTGDRARIRRVLESPHSMCEQLPQYCMVTGEVCAVQSPAALVDIIDTSNATRLAMLNTAAEAGVRAVIARLDAAWKVLDFEGFEGCFHEHAVIVSPVYAPVASGRAACAQSYREFANNAAVLDYSESDHRLHLWGDMAVYTFAWKMTYERENVARSEKGTDQLVLGLIDCRWQILFRHIVAEPKDSQ